MGGVDDSSWWRQHATRQRVHQATHTANTAKHTKGAKQTMSACTPCALRFYISSTARGRYTHSRLRGDKTLTRGREGRERSSASALQHGDSSAYETLTGVPQRGIQYTFLSCPDLGSLMGSLAHNVIPSLGVAASTLRTLSHIILPSCTTCKGSIFNAT